MASSPLNKIERAHQMYRDGSYDEALGFYTEALGMAKTKSQKIALHSNRAACYLKLHDFKKAAEECTSVLELDYNHTGALMLRAQTLVTLREYHSALFDVNRLLELNPSSEVYQNLQARLRTQLSLAPIPESEAELEEEDEVELKGDGQGERAGGKEDPVNSISERDEKAELGQATNNAAFVAPVTHVIKISSQRGKDEIYDSKNEISTAEVIASKMKMKESSEQDSQGWKSIPKPKGHSALDYARWDSVEDDSSEDDDDDDEESQPQYKFRVRTIGVRPVK
ncbi:Tetratricopeptide repeat-containing protein [Quillaja saponaria]|uniref:Tetratricopeptide repeat-containing protein n=1 Tax=Quillaja saponaria TaxID=32244 RepID=A0AAD7QI98_QUISA|nr:Tetratricopeptide repeat-containing protein [Quillaja saponaria]